MCVFMICIDPCAWQIGYKLGNILPGKWNTLDCGSTLGCVLNSHGHCDILFVGVRTSVLLCVCLSGVIVIYRVPGSFMEIFWHHNTSGYWVPLPWVRGKDESVPWGVKSLLPSPRSHLPQPCQPQNENICWWIPWQIKFPSGLNLDHVLFQ